MTDNLSLNLRYLRQRHTPRLSQARLADKLGVCRSTYAKYEEGVREPPAWFIQAAAVYFGVTADALMGLSNPQRGDISARIP